MEVITFLDLLVILFWACAIVPIVGIPALYLIKNKRLNKLVFFTLVVFGFIFTIINLTSVTSSLTFSVLGILRVIALGTITVLAIIVNKKGNYTLAKLLIVVSLIAQIVDMFVFL